MIRINFMGDVMFGELLENYRRGLGTALERRGIDPFEHAAPVLKRAHLNVVNLECVFSDRSMRKKPFSDILVSPSKFVIHLVESNINIVNTANNHALDHGREAFEGSLELLAHHGIKTIGYRKNSFFQEEPAVMELEGRKIGFLGYNISNFPDEDKKRRIARIAGVVKGIRPSLDTIVVSMHWGEEYTNIPPPYVVAFGRELLEAGCDIIHGHHSHRIQGVLRDGGRIFAPSLGNFVFDQMVDENRLTAILQVEIRDGELDFRYSPYYMNDLYQPVPAPLHEGYIGKIDGLLAECWEEGRAALHEEAVRKMVEEGHRKNRLRMRTRMLSHFWDYLPYTAGLLSLAFGNERLFSVIGGEEEGRVAADDG